MKPTGYNAIYREDGVLQEHLGNPLICGFPRRFEPTEVHKQLKLIPQLPTNDITDANKFELLTGLENRVHIPTRYHIDLYQHLYAQIITGYESRNPIKPAVIEWTLDAADDAFPIVLDDQCDPTSLNNAVIGNSGLGKTTTVINVVRRLFPQCKRHNHAKFEETQIVYLVIDVPHKGGEEAFCHSFFEALDKALGINETEDSYFLQHTKKKEKADFLLKQVHFYCRKHHIGLIVIDELQNLLILPPKRRQQFLNFLSSITNQTKVPVLKVGTSDVMHLFKNKNRNVRRKGSTFELKPYSKDNKYWNQLLDALFDYQFASKAMPNMDEFREYLHDLTQGYPYALLALWRELQVDALKKGSKQKAFTLNSIDNVWKKRYPLLRNVFRAIKNHRTNGLNDLLDAQSFLDAGYFDKAIKYFRQVARNPNVKGRSAEEVAASIDVMIDEYDFDTDQTDKLIKVKQRLEDKKGKIKAGQTYEQEASK
ncbi:AAA family ATPase [Alteromonas australica]|uniref:AAA family ATPase n=1 Tax=Alteromonas australica TaxID=589873 RepID=UPI0035C83D7E